MKKIIILIILFTFSNEIKAEHFFDFYLHNLDLTAYPKIKVRGAVVNYVTKDQFFEGKPFPENITFFENDKELRIDASLKYINENVHFFTITYTTELPEESVREFLLKYNQNGFHNGRGQRFKYNPSEHNYIKELGKQTEYSDGSEVINKALSTYLNTLIVDYDRDGLQEMYILARNGLEVRKSPRIKSKVIGKLDFGKMTKVSLKQYGKEISVVENKEINLEIEGRFRKVNYKGKKGYVFDGYLTSFHYFNNTANPCHYTYSDPYEIGSEGEQEPKNYRTLIDYNDQLAFIELYYLPQQESYLIAQAIFGDFKEFQKSGKITTGETYSKFENANYMFKLKKMEGYDSYFKSCRIYFDCSN